MKFQISNLKFQITAVLLLYISSAAFADDSIWNRVFFLDFQAIGGAIIEDPVKTGAITAGFGLTTYLLMKNDLWLSEKMRQSPDKFKDGLFDAFNYAGEGVPVLAADTLLFSLGGEKEKKAAVSIVEGLAVSGAIVTAIKWAFGRVRPSHTDDPLEFKWLTVGDTSYPSGHTQTAFLCATILGDRYDIGWLTYPAAAMTGLARIYKRAHWPSDVLLGAVIGVVTGKVINNLDAQKDVKVSINPGGLEFAYSF